MIVHTTIGSQFNGEESMLQARLRDADGNREYKVNNFKGSGRNLHIKVTDIDTTTTPSIAKVDIYLDICQPGTINGNQCGTCSVDGDCPAPTGSDAACTEAKCGSGGECIYKAKDGCFPFELDLLLDDYVST